MRSSEFHWLLRKEFRELFASRAFWLLLLVIGPLVGQGFITAVDAYAEASGIGGGPSALAQGLSPLDGILVPTLGAYDLAVTLLFPFIVVQLVAGEKQSGAWKLMLQTNSGIGLHLLAKGLVLGAGWMLAWVPGIAAVAHWSALGGTLYAPEVLNLLLGHLLRVMFSVGVAVAAAAIANGAASAAIATLGFTVGTWVLEFVAVGRGGWLQAVASYTPTSALRNFEQGQLRLGVVLILTLLGLLGFLIANIWLSTFAPIRRRLTWSVVVVSGVAVLCVGSSVLRPVWDLSENRRNSFSEADETVLRQLQNPLKVTVYLAPEDPRLLDLA